MTKHREILNFIYTIRKSHPSLTEIFTKGSCWKFHRILKCVYPSAEPYYDNDHIITKIRNKFYDINGTVLNTSNHLKFDLTNYTKKQISYRLSFWDN